LKIKLIGTDWQKEVIEHYLDKETRFLSVMAGRRAGKTFVCRSCLTTESLQKHGNRAWYIAPTYSQAKEQYEGIASLPVLQPFIAHIRQQPYPVITFRNNSFIGFRSFERPKTLRGSGLDSVWIDEIQDINGDEFWPVVRPLISDRRGKLAISGQHRGTESWYYKELFLPGMSGSKGYKSWQIPSSRGLVYQTPEGQAELELVKEQVPKMVFEQEYMCLPLANQASVFDYQDLSTIKRGTVKQPSQCGAVIFGLDLGRVVDPSAQVGIEASTKTVVFAEKRPLKEKHELGAVKARDIANRYGGGTIVVDTTGGATGGKTGNNDAYVQYYRKECPSMRAFTISRENKSRIIGNLSLAIEQEKLSIPAEFEDLHKELAMYEYNVSSNGIITYQGPQGHNDDMVIALALAWEGVLRGWGQVTPMYQDSII
jgi:hypothetical protein